LGFAIGLAGALTAEALSKCCLMTCKSYDQPAMPLFPGTCQEFV
jgi:hypothetical protein